MRKNKMEDEGKRGNIRKVSKPMAISLRGITETRFLAAVFLVMVIFAVGGTFSADFSTSLSKIMGSFLPRNADVGHAVSVLRESVFSEAPSPTPSDPEVRQMEPIGTGAYLFVKMSAYRGGPATFAVVGLLLKPLHVYGNPRFDCEWVGNGTQAGKAYRMLTDWGYGRVYTAVVINCTFTEPVGTGAAGGRLVITASVGDSVVPTQRFTALEESPGAYDPWVFVRPPPYDYLYCGSPLFSDLSPQRIREWMAYHAQLFGPRSHFILHDAGGVHAQVREVLKPWIEKGLVTMQDIRSQEPFDGYYHNQFMVVNDCLHRYKFAANWTFFFDVDEYLYVPPPRTLSSVLDEFRGFTQFTIAQFPMSSSLCLNSSHDLSRQWGFEKLVFRDVQKHIRRDRKYVVQARNVYSAGVHLSQYLAGKTQHKTEGKIRYYHYHNSINKRKEACTELVDASIDRKSLFWFEKKPYALDLTLKYLANSVKQFEKEAIGSALSDTPQ